MVDIMNEEQLIKNLKETDSNVDDALKSCSNLNFIERGYYNWFYEYFNEDWCKSNCPYYNECRLNVDNEK